MIGNISASDKLYVRLSMRGIVKVEFELTQVNDMTELYGELRHHTRGLRGLMQLYVRNITRGWTLEQPFKLYGETYPLRRRTPAYRGEATSHVNAPMRHRIPESVQMLFRS